MLGHSDGKMSAQLGNDGIDGSDAAAAPAKKVRAKPKVAASKEKKKGKEKEKETANYAAKYEWDDTSDLCIAEAHAEMVKISKVTLAGGYRNWPMALGFVNEAIEKLEDESKRVSITGPQHKKRYYMVCLAFFALFCVLRCG